MSVHKLAFKTIAISLTLFWTSHLFAQMPSPSPSSTVSDEGQVVGGPKKSPRERVGYVRVWYFGNPNSPNVTVACSPASGDPSVIGSSIAAGRVVSYRMMKNGSYMLNVIDGNIVPDAAGHIPASKPLAPPLNIEVKGNTFLTVVIHEENGKFTMDSFQDERASATGGSIVRVFNYCNLAGASIHLSDGKQDRELGNSSSKNPEVIKGLTAADPCQFQLVGNVDGKRKILANFEGSLDSTTACSVVAFSDRYGDPALMVVEDAKAPFTDEMIKTLAGE